MPAPAPPDRRPLRHAAAGLLALAVGALFAGCDLAPMPDLSNPRDPAFEGARLPDAPSGLRIAGATSTSIALAWTNESTFASEVHVEVETTGVDGRATVETLARLPATATAYEDRGITALGDRRYRVRAVAPGGRTSALVELRARFPVEEVVLTPVAGFQRMAPDGASYFRFEDFSTVIERRSVGTNAVLRRYPASASGPLATELFPIEGGRELGFNQAQQALVYGPGGLERTVTLEGREDGCFNLVPTPDGRQVVGYCGGFANFGWTMALNVWALETGALLRSGPRRTRETAVVHAVLPVEGLVVASVTNGSGQTFTAHRLSDLSPVWTVHNRLPYGPGPQASAAAKVLVYAEGLAYEGGQIRAVDLLTGRSLWSRAYERRDLLYPFDAEGVALAFAVATGPPGLHPPGPFSALVLDARTGAVRRQLPGLSGEFGNPPLNVLVLPGARGLLWQPAASRVARYDFGRAWEAAP